MRNTEITKFATSPLHQGDNKTRCKYCNCITRKERIEKHEEECQIVCFNFLHNIINHKIEKQPFTNKTEILLFNEIGKDTKWKPMNVVDVYKTMNKYHKKHHIKESIDIQTQTEPETVEESINQCYNQLFS